MDYLNTYKILTLMADGALNTIFTQEEFDKQKRNLSKELNHKKKRPAVAEELLMLYLGKTSSTENT
jgi:predicted Zn-dependent peptidase